ncbi:hypothetical protein KP509_13G015700 [Ceratopteris richardii]|nr:hypothetical protein KP509_13G015700 [Ceratopteris richardii]
MLIAGFVQNGCEEQALCCFQEMKEDGVSPDAITFTCILKACGYLGALSKGQDIHVEMAREGLVKGNIMAANALLDMYAKCGSLSEAEKVFNELPAKDVVSWTTLIGAYAQNGCGDEALCCFKQMEDEGLTPNIVTLICILRVCSMKRALDKGQEVHARSLKEGLPITSIVLVTTLMDMYAKCGMLLRAETLMAELSVRNVVTWTALITGYVQHGPNERALMCFELMQHEKVSPNIITYLCLLKACSSLGTLYMGQKIHSELVKKDLLEDQNASTALLDMYAKNGLLLEAYYTFDMLAVQDVTCWNALLTGYVQLGQCNGIFRLIESMIKDGQELDVITITIVLNACSHRGLLDEGLMYFSTMTTLHGITPTLEHHNCLLDLFGSAGLLDRAVWIIMDMPFLTNATVWHTMLGACQKCGDMNLGMWAFRHAAQLEDSNAAAYVLMSNISVSACWGENVSSSLQLF